MRSRLIREALARTLGDEPGVHVTTLSSSSELVAACADLAPDIAVMELSDADRDVVIARALVRRRTSLRLIGISSRAQPDLNRPLSHAGFHAIVAQQDGVAGVARAFRGAVPLPLLEPRVMSSRRPVLSKREVEVLDLVAAGLTASEVAERLHTRLKTVENQKQSIFWKLGVQSQAHAVAAAMRWGVLTVASSAAN